MEGSKKKVSALAKTKEVKNDLMSKGLEYAKKKDFGMAIQTLEQALKENPNLCAAHLAKGSIYL
jgi:Tfp pilus assembly protein PilF